MIPEPNLVDDVGNTVGLDINGEVNGMPAETDAGLAKVESRNKARTVNEPQHCIYGIDLGTTYSVVGYIDETGRPAVTRNSDSQGTTPSVVYFEIPGNIVVGKIAKEPADVYPKQVTPPSISALIPGALVKDAETSTHRPVNEAVITVPAITRHPSHLPVAERWP